MPIDATIGNNNEFSCEDASSMFTTESDTDSTLESMLLLALSSVEPNSWTSDFKVSSSAEVSSKIEFSSIICSENPFSA